MSVQAYRERLRTVQLVPMTAYDSQGEVNPGAQRELISRLRAAGIRVFIPAAGSAEFDGLSHDEIVRVVAATREGAGADAAVMAPIGRQVREAIRLGNDALRAGADSVLVMPLSHPYLSNVGAREYYRAILDGIDGPVLLYKKADIPSDDVLLELAAHPRLVGVKYAVNDVDAFRRIVQKDGDRIDWYCGTAERFAPFFMSAGARGYTSGAGNLCPRLTLAMHAALVAGDWSGAMRHLEWLQPIEEYRARAGSSYNITFLKYALKHVGLEFGPPRPPNRQLTEAERQEIDQMLTPILAAERAIGNVAS